MLFRSITAVALAGLAECQMRTTTRYMNGALQRTTTIYLKSPLAGPTLAPQAQDSPLQFSPNQAQYPPAPSYPQFPQEPPYVAGSAPPYGPGYSSGSYGGPQSRRPPGPFDAQDILHNPTSIVYQANLRSQTGLKGIVTAQAGPGGVGVMYEVEASGLSGFGPFGYHIYEERVPPNGDCSFIRNRLDPRRRGFLPVCDAIAPEACQVGDLSGKYGRLNDRVPYVRKLFVDRFTSLKAQDASFIGSRSFAVVDLNNIVLACGNFVEAEDMVYDDDPKAENGWDR